MQRKGGYVYKVALYGTSPTLFCSQLCVYSILTRRIASMMASSNRQFKINPGFTYHMAFRLASLAVELLVQCSVSEQQTE